MVNRLKKAIRTLFVEENAGRSVTVFDDDIFIVSYPKSGNTWVRFLVANVVYKDRQVNFGSIERLVPDIYQHSDFFIRCVSRPRFIKSHEYFDPRYKRVLYIVRDPRDVVVSYWYYKVKIREIKDGFPMDEFVDRFVSGDLDPFGSWGDNVGSWLGARKYSSNFMLVRYEDLSSDPVLVTKKIVQFFGLARNEKDIISAVNNSSINHMKDLEKKDGQNWKPMKKARSDIPFVRQGSVGGWKNVLSDVSVAKIENSWRELLVELGYDVGEG
ncbi:sulfotransferase domain-containing protein [Geothermobacter ehrlichii]|uniref:Sulfotransferase domain-containing protein n=1 Tax=Geothermobacter ehrlichii TaxID=213224 RepID=A0A5D3WJK7_9BACT|nr:sulfotransferase domain-containing protein [Geothermobacter ehrlichii]TYO96058.1 sulfotransferase domain-containing protein [Geothermobacter ehrlichii]